MSEKHGYSNLQKYLLTVVSVLLRAGVIRPFPAGGPAKTPRFYYSGKRREQPVEERPEDRPDDVPSKATITVKEINDNRYYYWQWREGEKIRSKYKGPVDSDN
ncbi:hypothetical protein [Haloferax chudinovii]|mgnify:FL=1|uniref:DUF6788 domain-containing protein n=1 Tax=Haloferax chudinovii TaxID=1109010 RepID=A0ABD5XJE2_9EURY